MHTYINHVKQIDLNKNRYACKPCIHTCMLNKLLIHRPTPLHTCTCSLRRPTQATYKHWVHSIHIIIHRSLLRLHTYVHMFGYTCIRAFIHSLHVYIQACMHTYRHTHMNIILYIIYGYPDSSPGHSPHCYTVYVGFNNCHEFNFYLRTALLSSIQLPVEQRTCLIKCSLRVGQPIYRSVLGLVSSL